MSAGTESPHPNPSESGNPPGAAAAGIGSAESFGAAPELLEFEILDLLASLVEKSLVQYEETPEGGRYRLLETVGQYAAERLDYSGDRSALKARHQGYFGSFVGLADVKGPLQKEWFKRLESDWENIRAAIRTGIDRPEYVDGSLEITRFTGRYFQVTGHLAEGIEAMEAVLALAEGSPPTQQIAATHIGLGTLYWVAARIDDSLAAHSRAVEAFLAIGDMPHHAQALANLAVIQLAGNKVDLARELLESAIAIQVEVGDADGAAGSRLNLGNLLMRQREDELARQVLEESVAHWRKLGNAHAIAVGLNNLAQLACRAGSLADAKTLAREALELRRDNRDHHGIMWSLEAIGKILLASGDAASSALLYEFSTQYREANGIRRSPADVAHVAEDLDSIRALLSPDALAQAKARAAAMDLDQAISLALTLAE